MCLAVAPFRQVSHFAIGRQIRGNMRNLKLHGLGGFFALFQDVV